MSNLNVAQFKKELKELLEKHDVSIGVDIEGDTHDLRYDFVVFDNTEHSHSLYEGYQYIDASDLKD